MYDSSNILKADISEYYYTNDIIKLPINIYLPNNFNSNKKYKTVIAIHGGSWHGIMCSPENWDGGMMAHTANYYVNMRYVGITFSYRDILFDKATSVKDLIADCRNAVRYIAEHYDFIDRDNIIFIGESAGGHLCLSLVMELDGKNMPLIPKTVILYNPVTDCTVTRWQHLAPDREQLRMCSPIYNIKKLSCDLIAVHGTDDAIVPISDTRRFCDEMKKVGNRIDMLEIQDGVHSFALFNYKSTDEYICSIYEEVNRYLKL